MNLLSIEKMTKSYAQKQLFTDISVGIDENDKVGIIGVNGTGKSTLLKVIAGLAEPDEGKSVTRNGLKISYLDQNPVFDEELTILQNVIKGIQREEAHWNVEGEAAAMLKRLGIPDVSQKPSLLSGGQKKRAALASVILTPSDLLLLDEPTNHLDSEMAEWLEQYLNRFPGALVMVTHDRYFLDRVANRIWEIDKGKLYTYTEGGYTQYLLAKAEREEMEQAAERKNKSLYRKDLEWMMRGARARSTKQKAHIARFEALRDREKPEEETKLELTAMSSRLGKKTIQLNEITKSYDGKLLFSDFSYSFLPNDRIGIIGKNGCGKSTLLRIITGGEKPDKGSVELGATIKAGYFKQENEGMDEDKRVIDYIREAAEVIETPEGSISASRMLERFLFSGPSQYDRIGKLSGGERRRLYLLRILMEKPNILILDEPTNDLDVITMSVLEDYLDEFQGIVITVSHDRYFLDRIVKRIFAFEEGKIRRYEGGFTDYYKKAPKKEAAELEEKGSQAEKGKKERVREPKLRFTFQEQREYGTINSEIEQLEQKLLDLEALIGEEAHNYSRLNELMEEKQKAEGELEEKLERWLYLQDLSERIEAEKRR